MSLLNINGASDPENKIVLDESKFQKDHIFPKSKFKFDRREDSILNMTWLTKETNTKTKRDRPPSNYIQEIINKKYRGDEPEFIEVLESHFINKNCLEFLKNDEFEKFIEEREEIFLEKIRVIIGAPENKGIPTMIKPDTPFTNIRILRNAVSSCVDYVYWVDKYFSVDDFDILIDGIKNLKEVKILTIAKTVDWKLRNYFKRFRDELANQGIVCEMRAATDPDIFKNHDRWIISKTKIYNSVSGEIARRGEESSVLETKDRPSIDQWWENSLDVIENWEKIKESVMNEYTCGDCGTKFQVPYKIFSKIPYCPKCFPKHRS